MKKIFTLILILFTIIPTGFSQTTPIAQGKSKFLGCIYVSSQTTEFKKYFNQVTPENEGKWGSVERTMDVFDFGPVDAARKFAKDNGFPFRFHVLVWGNQQPTWLKALSDTEKVKHIKEWFKAVADHYDGSSNERAVLEYVEVVNEILNDPPDASFSGNITPNIDQACGDYLNALRSLNTELNTTAGTYDWVVNAFKLARQYFPSQTKLVLNEYNIENNSTNMSSYVQIVNLLKADNLIDVVGMQAHAFSTKNYGGDNTYALSTNLSTLAATGLPIMITEMDIDGNVGSTQTEKDANQLAEYQRVFNIYWNHPSVMGITLWGFTTGMWRGNNGEAFLINQSTFQPRPALSQYLNTIIRSSNPPSTVTVAHIEEDNDILGVYPNPSAGGVFTVEVKDDDYVGKTSLKIFDMKGSVIADEKVSSNKMDITREMIPGIYFVKVIGSKGVLVKKLVVQ